MRGVVGLQRCAVCPGTKQKRTSQCSRSGKEGVFKSVSVGLQIWMISFAVRSLMSQCRSCRQVLSARRALPNL